MAKITIEGRPYVVAPYKLGKLRRAAPFVDHINETAGALSTLEGMMNASRDICEVAAIGLLDFDPQFTADYLEEQFGLNEMPELQLFLQELLAESGLARKGEATAPSEQPEEGAVSTSNSDGSSTSSSRAKSKVAVSAE